LGLKNSNTKAEESHLNVQAIWERALKEARHPWARRSRNRRSILKTGKIFFCSSKAAISALKAKQPSFQSVIGGASLGGKATEA
jgi:hypothetical protein